MELVAVYTKELVGGEDHMSSAVFFIKFEPERVKL